MTPDEALERLGQDRRHFAELSLQQHRMAAIAYVSGRFGGWVGKDLEVMRFLAYLSLWRECRVMSAGLFDFYWPHHRAGICYAAWPACRN